MELSRKISPEKSLQKKSLRKNLSEKISPENGKMKIFVDIDEVADFTSYSNQVLASTKSMDTYTDEQWQILAENPRMYRNLPVKKGAVELIEWLSTYNEKTNTFVAFMTAVPRSVQWAFQDKVHWANEHFPNIPVFFGPYSKDKWKHCSSSSDILIDDRLRNCIDWSSKGGGLSFQYTDWPTCKTWLEAVLK